MSCTRRPSRGHAAASALAVLLTLASASVAVDAAGSPSARAPLFSPSSSVPRDFVHLATPGRTLFWALVAPDLYDLWATDGTAAGTRRLLLCPEGCSAGPATTVAITADQAFYLQYTGDKLYLWRSDGTPGGTRLVTTFPYYLFLGEMAWNEARGELFFLAWDSNAGSRELWVSGGTAATTRRLHASSPEGFEGVSGPVGVADRFVLTLDTSLDDVHRLELWTSDGTTGGTGVLQEIPGVRLGQLVVVGDDAYFFSAVPVPATGDCRLDLWTTRGTEATTSVLRSFPRQGSCPGWVDAQIWDVDGVAMFLAGFPAVPNELWVSDGSAAGTRRLTDFSGSPFAAGVSHQGAVRRGDRVFFVADDGTHGRELWTTTLDRPVPGGTMVADLCPGFCHGSPERLQVVGDQAFFQVTTPQGLHLWRSDGTAAGTRRRLGLCEACYLGSIPEVRSGDQTFLVAYVPEDGLELFVSDSDTGDVRRLTHLAPAEGLESPSRLTPAGHGPVLFGANDGIHGFEPWISDGTVAGTHLLADLAEDDDTPTGPPAAPPAPVVEPWGESAVLVIWQEVPGAGLYRFEVRGPGGVETFTSEFLSSPELFVSVGAGTPVAVRVRAENVFGVSAWSPWAAGATQAFPPGSPCVESDDTLCLRGDRFRVEVAWRDQRSGDHGVGHTLPAAATDRTGVFWFFKPDNVELIVKLLDGSVVNGYWWTFYGALTDVEYWITVTDTLSGNARTYHNPPQQVCGRGDTASIGASRSAGAAGGLRSSGRIELPVAEAATPPVLLTAPAEAPDTCVEDAHTLCLLGGRYRVRVSWQDQHNGGSGAGSAVPFADRTGFFTFFNPNNVELVVKVLDGTPVNGKVWVFYGALSDVGYTLTVDDLVGGVGRSYVNTPGNLCGRADTTAF